MMLLLTLQSGQQYSEQCFIDGRGQNRNIYNKKCYLRLKENQHSNIRVKTACDG